MLHGTHVGCAAEGAGALLASQLLSTPPPLLLCRKPKACTPADSAGARSPVLLMLLELLLRLLERVVVYFCCYSCHNHATNAAPGLHLRLLAIGSAAAAAAISGNEPMFLRFLAFCCCHFQRQMQRKEKWLIFDPAFSFSTSISQLVEATHKLAGKGVENMALRQQGWE